MNALIRLWATYALLRLAGILATLAERAAPLR